MKNHDIIQQLKNLKSVAPSSEWKIANERALISYMQANSSIYKAAGWRMGLAFIINSTRKFALQPAVLMLLLFSTFLGSSLLVNAAFYSLPGDSLYPMKIRLERVQLALVSDEKKATDLKIEFAQKRVNELDKVISQTDEPTRKTEKVHIAIKSLKQNIESVQEEVDKKDSSRETNFRIALSLNSSTKELEKTIGKSEGVLSEDAKKSVEGAIDTAEDMGITALKGSIPSTQTTSSPQVLESDSEKNQEIENFIKKKLVAFEEKLALLEKDGTLGDDKVDEIAKMKELIKDAKESQEAGDFDAALTRIQEIKNILRKIENLDDVGMQETGDSVGMSQIGSTATATDND